MRSQPTVQAADRHGDHYHVRFRDPDDPETRAWASELAEPELSGSDVRTGQDETDEWLSQRVRVPADRTDGGDDASRKALQVVSLITDHERLASE